jgi:hypothetical protein
MNKNKDDLFGDLNDTDDTDMNEFLDLEKHNKPNNDKIQIEPTVTKALSKVDNIKEDEDLFNEDFSDFDKDFDSLFNKDDVKDLLSGDVKKKNIISDVNSVKEKNDNIDISSINIEEIKKNSLEKTESNISNKSGITRYNSKSGGDGLFDDEEDLILSNDNSLVSDDYGLKNQSASYKVQISNLMKQIELKNQQIKILESEKSEMQEEILNLQDKLSGNIMSPSKSSYNISQSIGNSSSTKKISVQRRLTNLGLNFTEISNDDLLDTLHDESKEEFLNVTASIDTLFGNNSKSAALFDSVNTFTAKDLIGSSLVTPRREYSNDGSNIDYSNSEKSSQLLDSHGLVKSSSSSQDDKNSNNIVGDDSNDDKLFSDNNATTKDIKTDEPETEISYQEFLNRLALSESFDIVELIRRFLSSILGPHGDATPPLKSSKVKIDYIFYGTTSLVDRCRDFFDSTQELFMKHPKWKHENEDRIMSARDCLERYVMNRIAEVAFKSVENIEDDNTVSKRMQLLSFIGPDALDIKAELQNDIVWALARDELKKINSYRTPGEKIDCIVKCASVIFKFLSVASARAAADGELESAPGADDFLPVFIYVVLHSHVPKLMSNCEYIASFHNPARLRSKAGYCFVNLQSAAEFIMNMDAEFLSMDPMEFEMKIAQAQRELNGGF